MKIILLTTFLFAIILLPLNSFASLWKPLGKMNMGRMPVTIYVDKSSIQSDENNKEYKKSWVKFDLPRNVKSEYNDELYRSREELYYFHCGENLFTVAHIKLLDSEDKVIYDSGEFNPFTQDYDDTWKLITPNSGPDLVDTYVCKLEHTITQDDYVPEWMKKKDGGILESPSLSKNISSSKTSLKNIRWAMRDDGSERLVFDLYSDEEKVLKPDNYKVIDEAKDNAMDILFTGYENVEAALPDLGESKIIKEIIKSYDEDKNGINIKIIFNISPEYNVFEVENPGRLVVDFVPVKESS